MNQEIPKPLRNALARQRAGDVHPSPDALTSFMERTLPPLESEVVVHHLAQCAECREIVFLASEAAEDEAREERFAPAAAASRVAAVPAYVATTVPAAARAATPRGTWTTRTRWAMSIAAVVLVVAGGLVMRLSRAGSEHNAAQITVASNRPVSAMPETQQTATPPYSQEASAKPSVPETLPQATQRGITTAGALKVPAPTTVARNASDESAPASKANPAAAAASAPSTPSVIGGATAFAIPATPTQNSFAESETTQAFVQPGAPLMFGKARVGLQAVSVARPQWRISPQGHLERSIVPDVWTRVLDDRPVTFRAVAAMENDVWAGGNGGALFHSVDRGEHWSRVSLTANSNVETGAIASIHFDDTQHGTVTSAGGTRWATTDGGLTWLTQ